MLKGLGNLANLGNIMQQAQQMGSKMKEVQESLKTRRVTGEAGGGMVAVEMSGTLEVVGVKIDAGLIERNEQEMIEDLTTTAVNDAIAKAKALYAEAMQEVTGGMNLPGMNDMLANLTGGQS